MAPLVLVIHNYLGGKQALAIDRIECDSETGIITARRGRDIVTQFHSSAPWAIISRSLVHPITIAQSMRRDAEAEKAARELEQELYGGGEDEPKGPPVKIKPIAPVLVAPGQTPYSPGEGHYL